MKVIGQLVLFAMFMTTRWAYGEQIKGIVDQQASQIQWSGSKVVGGSHSGFVKIASGYINYEDGKPVKGEIIVDMTSISNTDVEDPKYNKKLVDHLKSEDFFAVDKYGHAKIEITNIKHVKDGVFSIMGNLTIKDITKPVSFEATLKENTANKQVVNAKLIFDRTDFGVKYNSGRFFENLGDKIIKDQVNLDVSLTIKDTQKAMIL